MENKNSIPTTIRIFKNIKTGEWNLPSDHIMSGVQPDRHIRTPDGYNYVEATELGKVTYAIFLLQGRKYPEGYDPFKNAATGEEGLRVAKEQTEKINKEWEEKTSKFENVCSIDSQIQFIRNKREKLSQEGHFTYGMYRAIEYNLRAMQQMRNVDVVKVIADLVKELRQVYTITQGADIVDELPAIQNAEAALGMLDALNPKRRYIGWPSSIKEWTVQEVREALAKQPIEWKKAEITQGRRDEIVAETARLLLRADKKSDKKPSFLKANAIMFAIESVLNEKGL